MRILFLLVFFSLTGCLSQVQPSTVISCILPPPQDCSQTKAWIFPQSREHNLPNRIHAESYLYYVDDEQELLPREVPENQFCFHSQVGYALRNAYTMWVGIIDGPNGLIDETRCRNQASLIIKVYRDVLGPTAVAATPGRTIGVNFRQNFFYDPRAFAVKDQDGSINLTLVMAHELGHLFGLPHPDIEQFSIMLPKWDGSLPNWPKNVAVTLHDRNLLKKKLEEPLDGPEPGVMNSMCSGLYVR